MSVIKPRTRGKQFVRHITRLDRENNETLYAYAHFLGEPTEYVLNELIDIGAREGQGIPGVARGTSGIVCAAARESIEAHEASHAAVDRTRRTRTSSRRRRSHRRPARRFRGKGTTDAASDRSVRAG